MGGLVSVLFGSNGGNAANQVTEYDRAVLDLKHQRDQLEQYIKKVEKVQERETEIARSLLRQGKREQAMRCLKKRKYQEVAIKRAEGFYMNIQQLIDSIEFAQIQKKVFEELKKGTAYLKQLQEEMSLEKVEELMMETQEALEYQKEVDRVISQSLTPEEDEAAMRELEMLEQELKPEDLAPKKPVLQPEDEEDLENLLPRVRKEPPRVVEESAPASASKEEVLA